MSKVFILGAGFSKAVSNRMPTLWELSQSAIKWYEFPFQSPSYLGLSNDVEQLLTYLYQDMPWKTPEESYLDKAAFLMVSRQISTYISECEEQAFNEERPAWLQNFVLHLHQTESTVATLNYDTVLERATGEHPELNHIFTSNLYRMPIAPLGQRTAAVFAGETRPTYRLLKLHGSVNWYFSGDENVEGQQVYEDWLPEFIGRGQKEEESQKNIQSHLEYEGLNKMDLRPLIIPPVADKSAFYKTRTVRLTWSEFRKSLKESSELYCIGYSLPKTDLTMRLFLRAAVEGNPKRVYIVNSATGDSARELKRSYQEVFAGCSIDEQYFGRQDAVKHMTDNLSQA